MSTPGTTNFFISNQGTVRIHAETKAPAVEINNSIITGSAITIHPLSPIRRLQNENKAFTEHAMGHGLEFFRPSPISSRLYEASHGVIREEQKEVEEKKDSCCERLRRIFRCEC